MTWLSLVFTLLLCNSHLALRQSSALKIPDGEHRRAWDDVLKFNHVLQRFSNASGTMYEATSANIFRTFILLKMVLPLPQGDMDDYSGGDEMGLISINEGQSGDGCFDWRVVFPSCGPDRPQPLCATFEFKRIGGGSNQTSNHPFRMAQEGLEQIIDKRYAADISHTHRRLDVGVAIGMRTAAHVETGIGRGEKSTRTAKAECPVCRHRWRDNDRGVGPAVHCQRQRRVGGRAWLDN
ncbi:hypothetical protein GQ54DRAFT_297931 [Martensiomyces pterosporus]|nr:hypothetical protein GQ54DRAFT_297931 [Martensiomyces pterosporus]